MKKALRTLLALVVATALVGGALAGSAAAQDVNTISDDDLVDANVNALNPVTSAAANAVNIGSGSQDAVSDVDANYDAGDEFTIDD